MIWTELNFWTVQIFPRYVNRICFHSLFRQFIVPHPQDIRDSLRTKTSSRQTTKITWSSQAHLLTRPGRRFSTWSSGQTGPCPVLHHLLLLQASSLVSVGSAEFNVNRYAIKKCFFTPEKLSTFCVSLWIIVYLSYKINVYLLFIHDLLTQWGI